MGCVRVAPSGLDVDLRFCQHSLKVTETRGKRSKAEKDRDKADLRVQKKTLFPSSLALLIANSDEISPVVSSAFSPFQSLTRPHGGTSVSGYLHIADL